jgi:DNA-binding cell septation regulator SpoVG
VTLTVTALRFTPARSHQRATGLLGFASITLNDGIQLNSIAVRRTSDQRLVLSFPTRRRGSGREVTLVAPTSWEVQRLLQDAVLAELRRRGEVA